MGIQFPPKFILAKQEVKSPEARLFRHRQQEKNVGMTRYK
jgi:hypothetical protein